MTDSPIFWGENWFSLLAQGLEQMNRVILGDSPSAALSTEPYPPEPAFATLNRVRLDLPTMRLREREVAACGTLPTLIVAPYALHDASIADFSEGHSVAQTLAAEELGPIAVTHWKSASPEMRWFSIDSYLADLNVAIDDLGGRAALVGICQGGWLAAAYAARFPNKVGPLVLAGAPIDLATAESALTRAVAATEPELIRRSVDLWGGRVLGRNALSLQSLGLVPSFDATSALQSSGDDALDEKFKRWNAYTVNLPGEYFIQTTEWLFRENRLAGGGFPALGRICNLGCIPVPIFVLAAQDDEIVAPAQALAVKALCANAEVATQVVPGRHLSLFLGRRTLNDAWNEIARWLHKNNARFG